MLLLYTQTCPRDPETSPNLDLEQLYDYCVTEIANISALEWMLDGLPLRLQNDELTSLLNHAQTKPLLLHLPYNCKIRRDIRFGC